MRRLFFEDSPDKGNMIALKRGASYHFSESIDLSLNYHFQKYYEMKGSTTITDLATGEKFYESGEAAGLSHSSSLVSLKLRYAF
ncbi:MAG: omptin family outer membrane protease [Spirochaetales bacterium]|jgi:outer membrane protease|nr:omptin family outer membrane protease [Spirochaetales bacterium]